VERVRWWHSAIFAALTAAYIIWGLTGYDTKITTSEVVHIYGAGCVVACSAALAFMAIYTALGLRPGRAGWWTNQTGYSLIVLAGAVAAGFAVQSWAALVNGGPINTPTTEWLFVGSVWLTGLALISLCLLWIWNRDAGEPPPAGPPDSPS
jgi:hypothetical protein